MKINLPKYRKLTRVLKTLNIKVDADLYPTLKSLIAACNQYKEFESKFSVIEFGRPKNTELFLPPKMETVLVRLNSLPGGINPLLDAALYVRLDRHFRTKDEEDRCSLDEAFDSTKRGQYAWWLYSALCSYYEHAWDFHPDELECAELLNREPSSENIAFDVGAFNACNAIALSFSHIFSKKLNKTRFKKARRAAR